MVLVLLSWEGSVEQHAAGGWCPVEEIWDGACVRFQGNPTTQGYGSPLSPPWPPRRRLCSSKTHTFRTWTRVRPHSETHTYASPPFAPNTGPTGSVDVFLPSSGGPGSPVVAGPSVASSLGVAWSSITDRGMVRRVSSPQPSTRGRRLPSGSSSVVFSSFPWRTLLVPALMLLLLQRGATSMPLWSDPFASDRLC